MWSGQGPGNRTKCLEGGCLQRKELLVWGLMPGCKDQRKPKSRFYTAKVVWGEHLLGLLVVCPIGDRLRENTN